MARIAYTTRERVKRALDSAQTARSDAQVDDAIAAATDSIHGLCHRRFYPELKTVTFDWPNRQSPTSWRLWLEQHELVELTAATAGGTTLAVDDLKLYPPSGPPYDRVETDLSSTAAYAAGATEQQAVALTGLYAGAPVVEASVAALAEALDPTETSVDVTDGSTIGIGSLLRVDTERMIVTGRRQLDTGQTLGGDGLTAMANNTAVPVGDGTAFAVGEIVLIDAERMIVIDVAGNTLVVKRAWDGTVLAAHTTGAAIYSPRTLLVERGVLGTTAAAHDTAAPVRRWTPPALIESLAVAEALVTLGCEQAGYATQTRAGESSRSVTLTVDDIRARVYRSSLARKGRTRAV
jgi:hypothetical protein